MNVQEIERLFLAGLAERGIHEFQASRHRETGELIVLMESPCTEIGYIYASVNDAEITLSCKLTHTHSDAGYFRRCGIENPQIRMIDEAVRNFADFVQGRSLVQTEIGYDGRTISSGWRLIGHPGEPNPGYRALIEKLHGGPSTFRAWTWNGEIENYEFSD